MKNSTVNQNGIHDRFHSEDLGLDRNFADETIIIIMVWFIMDSDCQIERTNLFGLGTLSLDR